MQTLIFAGLFAAIVAREGPQAISVRSVSAQGSLCPQATSASASFNPESQQLEINFPELAVSIGPGVSAQLARGTCHLTLDLAVSEGWQYAVKDSRLWGELKIPQGWTGTIDAKSGFTGQGSGRIVSNNFPGKISDAVDAIHAFSPAEQIWSTCTEPAPLLMSFALRLRKNPDTTASSNASGYMSFHPHFHPGKVGLVFRRCAPN